MDQLLLKAQVLVRRHRFVDQGHRAFKCVSKRGSQRKKILWALVKHEPCYYDGVLDASTSHRGGRKRPSEPSFLRRNHATILGVAMVKGDTRDASRRREQSEVVRFTESSHAHVMPHYCRLKMFESLMNLHKSPTIAIRPFKSSRSVVKGRSSITSKFRVLSVAKLTIPMRQIA